MRRVSNVSPSSPAGSNSSEAPSITSDNQQPRRPSASQVPSLTYTPVVLSPVLTGGSVQSSSTSRGSAQPAFMSRGSMQPPSLSRGSAERSFMSRGSMQPPSLSRGSAQGSFLSRGSMQPLSTSRGLVQTPWTSRGLVKPGSVSRDKQWAYTPVMLSAVRPQAPMRVAGNVHLLRSGEDIKGKGPLATDQLHVKQSSTIGQTSGTTNIERGSDRIEINNALLEKGKRVARLMLQRYDPASACSEKLNAAKRIKCGSSNNMVTREVSSDVVMSVPKPDYYQFDEDRTEDSFGENQVWAAYDTDEIPRFYALVHSVVSQKPLRLCLSWMNNENNEELGPMKWVDGGFFKTSGHFSIGKRHILSLNPFSHRVKWTIGAKGCVYIYPKQGDVWALYSNWSPSWGISTPQEVVNKFDMVEVVRDFDEARGVTVVSLVKVPGFQQVFRRQPSPRTFPKQELFRFSHQVASHLLTGQGGKNDPQGYMELDPAAMPPHKVFTVGDEEIGLEINAGGCGKCEDCCNEEEEEEFILNALI